MTISARNGSPGHFERARDGTGRDGMGRDGARVDGTGMKKRGVKTMTIHTLRSRVRDGDLETPMDERVDDAPRKLELVLRHRLERVRF